MTVLVETAMNTSLQVLWVDCGSNRAAAGLFEECQKLCRAGKCLPAQALNWLEQAKPIAVVFEFSEPTATHLQLLRSVKRLHPSVPILMITESRGEELAVWAFRARVWNYLVKPVALRELRANVGQLLRVAGERGGLQPRRIERPGAVLPAAYAAPPPANEESAIRQAAEQIRLGHRGRISISRLARECRMSRFAFSRLFSKTFGCSCREYITRLRVESACQMLRTGVASVAGIAAATGFADASYFARQFRRHVGMSPRQFAEREEILLPPEPLTA